MENPVGCSGEAKRIVREGLGEGKTGTVWELSLQVSVIIASECYGCSWTNQERILMKELV